MPGSFSMNEQTINVDKCETMKFGPKRLDDTLLETFRVFIWTSS